MSEAIRHKLALALLVAYVPLLLTLGFLHTDDDLVRGDGRELVAVPSPEGTIRTPDSGPCLACLFMAGHFTQSEPILPAITEVQLIAPAPLSSQPATSPRPHSARAPPALLFS